MNLKQNTELKEQYKKPCIDEYNQLTNLKRIKPINNVNNPNYQKKCKNEIK